MEGISVADSLSGFFDVGGISESPQLSPNEDFGLLQDIADMFSGLDPDGKNLDQMSEAFYELASELSPENLDYILTQLINENPEVAAELLQGGDLAESNPELFEAGQEALADSLDRIYNNGVDKEALTNVIDAVEGELPPELVSLLAQTENPDLSQDPDLLFQTALEEELAANPAQFDPNMPDLLAAAMQQVDDDNEV